MEKIRNKVSISLENDFFYVNFNKEIDASIAFQIPNYGLESLSEVNFKVDKDKIKLKELCEYLRKEGIDIKLCDKSNVLVNNILDLEKKFNQKIETLSNLKKKFDTPEFSSFCEYFKKLNRDLKYHQKTSCFHLYNAGCAANFSVPGSGKTSVVLAYYQKLLDENEVDALFVIGPKNCFYSWQTEFNFTLGRNPKLKILGGGENKKNRSLIYKSSLKSELYAAHFSIIDKDNLEIKSFFKKNKFLLVIDEAHNIKKIDGSWSNAALNISQFSKYKVILTGTPIPNNFSDFFNYLEFLYGKNKILSNRDKAEIEHLMDQDHFDDAAKIIEEKINPIYVRVTKKELGLSKPIFKYSDQIEMNPIERKVYDAIVSKIRHYSKKDYLKNIETVNKLIRARVIRLRQTCSYVVNLLTAFPPDLRNIKENLISDNDIKELIMSYDDNEVPAKISRLKFLLKELLNKNKKVLVWSTHLKTIEKIKKELELEKINIKKIIGKTDLAEREKIKNEFNDKNSSLEVIIANPQACSESISLHKACTNSIYYDIGYNAAEFLQSLDRIHRVGGSEGKKIVYEFLHYKNTIDVEIFQRVFEKANNQMKIIESNNLTFSFSESDEDYDELYKSIIE